jgi:hypothetical protein
VTGKNVYGTAMAYVEKYLQFSGGAEENHEKTKSV